MGEPEPPVSAGEELVAVESEHLAAIVRSSEDAILSKDRSAIIQSWNEGAERLYGWTADEAVGKPVRIIIPPERQGEELEIIERIIAGERVEHYETERVRKDGSRVKVSLAASPIHGAGGEVVGVSTHARDISAMSQALDHAERRFMSAFQDAPIGMVVFSADPNTFGVVEQANAEMTRLWGYSEAELTQLRPGDLTHPDDVAREAVLLRELAAGERSSYGIEKRNRHKDGHWIWVWVTVSLLGGGEPSRLALAHVLDITERKRAEVELQQMRENLERSNAELDQFAYVASHDLKEPLILLSAYARMLGDRHGDAFDEEGRTFLGYIRGEADRMKTMIDDLLDYSRLETRAEEPVEVDLAQAVDTALRTLAPRLEEVAAKVDVTGKFPVFQGSPSQFERLFRNLISNAVKFRGDDPPAITVTVTEDHGGWVVEVADNGIGIDPARADRIFDVFQRLHSQDAYAGTGMGLAICKRVVERHGGRIWVEPRPEGGSSFKFWVPG
jgi:PAS domain S-box-containing protein